MNQTHVTFLRCPACGGALAVWDVREQEQGDIVEGSLACQACAATYQIHSRLPILLPSGRRAVDDFSVLLAAEATNVGFAESVRRLACGVTEYPIHEPFGKPITATEAREAPYRESESFWETFSRNRLVQQQLNAIDQHRDALEEMWMSADINLAESVLDVGTGWGGAFQHLLEYGPQDALIIGCDTAFLNLKVAQSRAIREGFEHAAFVVGDITVPPFPSAMYDAVVSWYGVGAVPQLRASLEGVLEVLAPGRPFAAAWTSLIDDMEGLAGRDDLLQLAERLDIPTSPDAVLRTLEAVGFVEGTVTTVGPIYVLSGRAPVAERDEPE